MQQQNMGERTPQGTPRHAGPKPLNTPEERAALKARLLNHADAIQDPDVRHHYREAFRERLDTLFARARPERGPRVPWAPPGQRGGGRRFQPDPRLQPPADETRSIGQAGIAAPLAAALIGSVTLMPGFVAFPLAAALLKSGAGYMQLAAFVSTLMMVGVVTIPIEKKTFGLKATIARNASAFVYSFVVAVVMGVVLG